MLGYDIYDDMLDHFDLYNMIKDNKINNSDFVQKIISEVWGLEQRLLLNYNQNKCKDVDKNDVCSSKIKTTCFLMNDLIDRYLSEDRKRSIIQMMNEYKNGNRTMELGNHFSNLHVFAGNLKNGIVVKGNMIACPDKKVVIKCPGEESYPFFHEAFIGLYGINSLINWGIPNFSYTYGAFMCSFPRKNEYGELILCRDVSPEKKDLHIVYEYIQGPSMAEYLRTCNFEDFMNIYIQIAIALDISNAKIGYTHYDLHTSNVIIQEISDRPFYLKYKYSENDVIYLKTNGCIATIIDYGRNYMHKNGFDFGPGEVLVEMSVFPDRPFIMNDLYKLLLFSLQKIIPRDELYKKIIELYYFFTSERDIPTLMLNVATVSENFNTIPYCRAFETLTDNQWNEFKTNYELDQNYMDDIKPDTHKISIYIKYCLDLLKSKGMNDIIFKEQDLDPTIPIYQLNN